VLQAMLDRGIAARPGIMAAHLEPAYGDHPVRPLPVTERLARQGIILPLFPQMSEADQDRVAGVLIGLAGRRASARPALVRTGRSWS